eukprot:Sspe_Gene.93547::Locus_66152_Transcript_9_10_Confidence_0.214_Length_3434::g.93547::m.93547
MAPVTARRRLLLRVTVARRFHQCTIGSITAARRWYCRITVRLTRHVQQCARTRMVLVMHSRSARVLWWGDTGRGSPFPGGESRGLGVRGGDCEARTGMVAGDSIPTAPLLSVTASSTDSKVRRRLSRVPARRRSFRATASRLAAIRRSSCLTVCCHSRSRFITKSASVASAHHLWAAEASFAATSASRVSSCLSRLLSSSWSSLTRRSRLCASSNASFASASRIRNRLSFSASLSLVVFASSRALSFAAFAVASFLVRATSLFCSRSSASRIASICSLRLPSFVRRADWARAPISAASFSLCWAASSASWTFSSNSTSCDDRSRRRSSLSSRRLCFSVHSASRVASRSQRASSSLLCKSTFSMCRAIAIGEAYY